MEEINAVERILVADDLQKRGVEKYTMRRGNDCVWVSYGRIDCYYVIRQGKIVNVIFD